MPVLINFKICDNAKECNGIAVCPTGALSWNEKKKSIKIDNEKCLSCGLCEKSCMVDAISVAKNEKEYGKIEKEIKADPRKIGDLFVDRYGAEPISLAFLTTEERFRKKLVGYEKASVFEFFNEDSFRCLLRSIPIKELVGHLNFRFRKVPAGKELIRKYSIKKLPALLFFDGDRLIGKIEGYYDKKKKDKLVGKVEKIVEKIKK